MIDLNLLLEGWLEDWDLLFVDEATVRRHPTLRAKWCLVEDVPDVPTGDDHSKAQVYGAVSPLTGRTHAVMRPTLSKGHVAGFLNQPKQYDRDKQGLSIHDRAPHHRGQALDEVIKTAQNVSKKCFGLDSADHEMDNGDINHRRTTRGEVFAVFAQPAVCAKPADGRFRQSFTCKITTTCPE